MNPRPMVAGWIGPASFETRTGKCVPCRVRYVWPRRVHRQRARYDGHPYCPKCGGELLGTNDMLQWPVVRSVPPYRWWRP